MAERYCVNCGYLWVNVHPSMKYCREPECQEVRIEAQKSYRRQWAKANRARLNEMARIKYHNPLYNEKKKAQGRVHANNYRDRQMVENREEFLAKKKAAGKLYYEKNKAKGITKLKAREYYLKNAEAQKQKSRQWHLRYKTEANEINNKFKEVAANA